jgi:two-component system chemotaxis response regulator CheY
MVKKVLICDDVAFFRTSINDILTEAGFEVVGEAANGAEAIERTRALKPDIVILDIVMPNKNGLEVAKELIRMRMPIKIVICSSLGYDPIVKEALKSGASAYILKPFDKANILDTLAKLDSAGA